MASLRDEAQAYTPPQTENIATLEKIPVDLDLKDGVGKEGTPDEFRYKYIEHEGKRYRVAGTVIGGLKSVLKKYPNTRFVTVDKEGEGMNTRYHVMPYVKPEVEDVNFDVPPPNPFINHNSPGIVR